MKCIKYNDGTIKRVSDMDAFKQVLSGECIYIPKKEWKSLGEKVREKHIADIDKSQELNKTTTKAERQKEKRKKYEDDRKKMEISKHKPKKPKKSGKK